MPDPARPVDLPPIDTNTSAVGDGDQIPPGLEPLADNPTLKGGE